MNFQNFYVRWARFKRHFIRFTWGGAWAAMLPEGQRRNLTLFFFDGLFSAASDKIILTYLTIYLLDLGASSQQIGLLSSLSNLAAALLLLPAAMLVERTGERKKTTLWASGGSRLMLLLIALLPMIFVPTAGLIWVILGMALLRETLNNFAYPGWVALTGDIIPLEGRGRYFGTRNFIMGVSGIVAALVVGNLITAIGSPLGYELAFLAAVVLGMASMYFFSRLRDHNQENGTLRTEHSSLSQIFQSVKGQKAFLLFCAFTAFWNFSLNIAGPFFNVYMVDTLKMSAATIGVITVTNTVANLLVQRKIGALSDKWGNRTLAIITLFLIPFIPLVWGLWAKTAWQLILIEIFSGALWGAFNLVSFNILLTQTPPEKRARFSALYQIVVTLSLAGGAALGSLLFSTIAFKGVAVLSAIGRWLAGLLFLILVKEVTLPSPVVLDEPEEQLDNPLEENLN
ncbi:MFS transporter [Chloroflexota bacterium]|nr:MFS transporter [Chloroflexota bacterium]